MGAAASRLIWLALHNSIARRCIAARGWTAAMNQFAILYKARVPLAAGGAA